MSVSPGCVSPGSVSSAPDESLPVGTPVVGSVAAPVVSPGPSVEESFVSGGHAVSTVSENNQGMRREKVQRAPLSRFRASDLSRRYGTAAEPHDGNVVPWRRGLSVGWSFGHVP